MAGIDRIGPTRQINREQASGGLEAQEKTATAKAPRNEKVDEAAKLMEKQFLREMVRAMRGTVSFGMMKPSMGESIYQGELDNQYVETWGDKGGIGLADLIYNQVMDRYFDGQEGRQLKASGAIELSDRDVSRVSRMPSAKQGQVPLKVDLGQSKDGLSGKLRAPWESEVISNVRLEGGKTALKLKHGPGLSSTLVFDGVAAADAKPGQHYEKGRQIATLSPEIRSFFWNLEERGLAGTGLPADSVTRNLQDQKDTRASVESVESDAATESRGQPGSRLQRTE